MHRTVLQYLDDILEAIDNIEEDTKGITTMNLQRIADAGMRLSRNFQVIGEAIK